MIKLFFNEKESVYLYNDIKPCDVCKQEFKLHSYLVVRINWDNFGKEKINLFCHKCSKEDKYLDTFGNTPYKMTFLAFVEPINSKCKPFIPVQPSLQNIKGDLSIYEGHKLKEGNSNYSKIKYANFEDIKKEDMTRGYIGFSDVDRERELHKNLNDDELYLYLEGIKTAEIEYKETKKLNGAVKYD